MYVGGGRQRCRKVWFVANYFDKVYQVLFSSSQALGTELVLLQLFAVGVSFNRAIVSQVRTGGVGGMTSGCIGCEMRGCLSEGDRELVIVRVGEISFGTENSFFREPMDVLR